MKTRLYIVRHAEAEGNVMRVFHGWTDSRITENGHKQAEKIAQRLMNEKFDIIVSSTITRAIETAEYIAEGRNLELLKIEELREINGGDWEKLSWSELETRWPKENHTWDFKPHIHQMPNGESIVELQKRVIGAIERILMSFSGKNICVVTHGTVIKALMCYFKGVGLVEMVNIPWFENTALTIIEHSGNKFDIILEGDDSHLDDDIATVRKQGWAKELEQKIAQTQQLMEED